MAIMIREDVASARYTELEAGVELRLTLVLDADTASSLELLLAQSGGRLRLVADASVDAPALTRPPVDDGALIEPLTAKEHEVLGHLSELLTTDEIATTMFVSINTVRTHVRNILRKLAVSRRNEAVRRARALHLLDAGGFRS